MTAIKLSYAITNNLELNFSFMPFIKEGGLFIPTQQLFSLGDKVIVELRLPERKEIVSFEGKVVWINPKNALHHILAGIGIQFSGQHAQATRQLIESMLDKQAEVGGYLYGITWDEKSK